MSMGLRLKEYPPAYAMGYETYDENVRRQDAFSREPEPAPYRDLMGWMIDEALRELNGIAPTGMPDNSMRQVTYKLKSGRISKVWREKPWKPGLFVSTGKTTNRYVEKEKAAKAMLVNKPQTPRERKKGKTFRGPLPVFLMKPKKENENDKPKTSVLGSPEGSGQNPEGDGGI